MVPRRWDVRLFSTDLGVFEGLPLLLSESTATRYPHGVEDVDERLVSEAHGLLELEHQIRVAEDVGTDFVLVRGALQRCQHAGRGWDWR